jgi:peroxiredoxin
MAVWLKFNAIPKEMKMSLKTELDAFRSDFMAKVSPEIREAMAQADMELAVSGIAQRALKAGDRAPDFRLPDARGGYVSLRDLLAKGPVVLSFYRGGWCPYCNLELRALQHALPEITRLGGQLVAISPQTPDESLSTAEKNEIAFPILSDVGSATARAFGIAYDVAEELRPIYARTGNALPDKNGDESWTLPIPATYVIDRDGTIRLAFVDVDYSHRLEPADILAALAALVSAAEINKNRPKTPLEVREMSFPKETIASLAYSLWEQRGSPEGTPEIDWFKAELVLQNRENHTGEVPYLGSLDAA